MKVYTELGTAQLQLVFLMFAINFSLFKVSKGSEILQGILGKKIGLKCRDVKKIDQIFLI